MSAPQLPDLALYGEWFSPDTIRNISTVAQRASRRSSASSQYSRETGPPSLDSAETRISLNLSSQDNVHHKSNLSAVDSHHFVVEVKPAMKQSMASILEATPDNSFLGFCKGAWTLQNGDQKGSMKKSSEADAWSRSAARAKAGTAQYLKCREPRCEFRSNFVSSNAFLYVSSRSAPAQESQRPNPTARLTASGRERFRFCIADISSIWNKVFTYESRGIKLRWPFLAKSHVPQRVVLNSKYCFKCLFCVFLGRSGSSTIYSGMDLYLDHIGRQHGGQPLGDVIEYKTRCISTRVADDKELFDINIWPTAGQESRETSMYLSDELLVQPHAKRTPTTSSLSSTRISREPYIPQQSRFGAQLLSPSPGDSDLVQGNRSFRYQPWEDNPAEIWGTSTEESRSNSDDVSSAKTHIEHFVSPPLRARPVWKLPLPPSSTHNLTASMMQDCLDSIVQLLREASAIIDAIEDNSALSQVPIVRLLAESVKEAPAEIEKEKNRATLRFGEAFQYGDYTAIWNLQQVEIQLRGGFLNLLQQAVYDIKSVDVAQLVDSVDSGRHSTVAALHDLKRRLVQSGYGAYHQPVPLSHPAHQPMGHSEAYHPTPTSGHYILDGRNHMSGGGGGGLVEGESAHSATSEISTDASPHVRFRREEIVAQTARRRGSILGFLKHDRAKSNNFLVDSKQKTDELAQSRRKSEVVAYGEKGKRRGKASVGLSESVVGIAELDGMAVVG